MSATSTDVEVNVYLYDANNDGKHSLLHRLASDDVCHHSNKSVTSLPCVTHDVKTADGTTFHIRLHNILPNPRSRMLLDFHHRSVCIVCFPINEPSSLKLAIRHQNIIRNRHPSTPILLVGTKSDLRENNDDSQQPDLFPMVFGHCLAHFVGAIKYLECSAKTGEGVNKLVKEVILALAFRHQFYEITNSDLKRLIINKLPQKEEWKTILTQKFEDRSTALPFIIGTQLERLDKKVFDAAANSSYFSLEDLCSCRALELETIYFLSARDNSESNKNIAFGYGKAGCSWWCVDELKHQTSDDIQSLTRDDLVGSTGPISLRFVKQDCSAIEEFILSCAPITVQRLVIISCTGKLSFKFLSALQGLERLVIVNTNIDLTCLQFPSNIIHSLKHLVLRHCDHKTTEVPPVIGRLSELEVLDVTDNDFIKLPVTLGGLRNLRILKLDQGRMIFPSPHVLRKSTIATIQYLNENQVESVCNLLAISIIYGDASSTWWCIDEAIQQTSDDIQSLTRDDLVCSTGPISLRFVKQDCSAIEEFILSCAPITVQRLVIISCTGTLSFKFLSALQEGLEHLVIIDTRVDFTCLHFPPDIVHSLKHLVLKRCDHKTAEVPLVIGCLSELEVLDVTDNGFIKLPFTLGSLRKLHTLKLDIDNYIFPPPYVLCKSTIATIQYLNENQVESDCCLQDIPNIHGDTGCTWWCIDEALQQTSDDIQSLTRDDLVCRTGPISLRFVKQDCSAIEEFILSCAPITVQRLAIFSCTGTMTFKFLSALQEGLEHLAIVDTIVDFTSLHFPLNIINSLEYLILRWCNNKSIDVPLVIGCLRELKVLDVARDGFNILPVTFAGLTKLHTLKLDSKLEWFFPPKYVLNSLIPEIIKYLKEIKEEVLALSIQDISTIYKRKSCTWWCIDEALQQSSDDIQSLTRDDLVCSTGPISLRFIKQDCSAIEEFILSCAPITVQRLVIISCTGTLSFKFLSVLQGLERLVIVNTIVNLTCLQFPSNIVHSLTHLVLRHCDHKTTEVPPVIGRLSELEVY